MNAPPGDVYHVHSLHRAWLASADRSGSATFLSQTLPVTFSPATRCSSPWSGTTFAVIAPRRVVAVSRSLAEDLHHFYGVPDELVTVIPNGFDPTQCNPQRRKRCGLNAEHKLGSTTTPVVVAVCRQRAPQVDLGVLLEAVARRRRRTRADPCCGPYSTRRLQRRDRRARADACATTDRPTTSGWPLGRRCPCASHAIRGVRPRGREALASGLPVITTAVPGAGERVATTRTGYSCGTRSMQRTGGN